MEIKNNLVDRQQINSDSIGYYKRNYGHNIPSQQQPMMPHIQRHLKMHPNRGIPMQAASYKNNIKYNNILFIHYNNLKNDLSGEIKNIAEFLEIEYDKHMFDTIVNNCTFETMKNDPTSAPLGGAIFDGGSQSFINQGKTGRWKDTLTDQCIDDYKIMASRYMDDNQIKWMETGSD
mmetsp:Transcript_1768/g.2287  ORF Transcript_1768/g.2287 Transcript_1768/m.2287 type:complete len:176 (-) Transcript_1768:79-606(-)